MDSLKTIFDRGDYGLVLTLTEGSEEPESLFYRLSSLLSFLKTEEALQLLLKHRSELFRLKPLSVLKANFELRFMLKQFDEAYQDIAFFENEPYMSQEVEEELRGLQAKVRSAEKACSFTKKLDEDEILEIIENPKDDFDLLAALNQLKKIEYGRYKDEIRIIAQSNRAKDVRTFALLLLCGIADKKPLCFRDGFGETLEIIPAELEPPFVSKAYSEFVKKIESYGKDPSLSSLMRDLADQYIMASYPKNVLEDSDALIRSLAYLAQSYLGMETDRFGDEVLSLAKKIEKVLTANPPLKY